MVCKQLLEANLQSMQQFRGASRISCYIIHQEKKKIHFI
uniref:Uncharacterized protein n=1 Tax=Rhizophora mucronata TaxID=61149 RepID=A0A2P2J316_RHIMU